MISAGASLFTKAVEMFILGSAVAVVREVPGQAPLQEDLQTILRRTRLRLYAEGHFRTAASQTTRLPLTHRGVPQARPWADRSDARTCVPYMRVYQQPCTSLAGLQTCTSSTNTSAYESAA